MRSLKFSGILILFPALFFSVADAAAQNEFLNKNNILVPMNKGMMSTPSSSSSTGNSVYTPNVFNKTKSESPSSGGGIADKPIEFKQQEFANPNAGYLEKLNQKTDRGEYKEFRKNQYFGEFKTGAAAVKIACRDFGEVDGDMIKVYVNGREVIAKIYLDSQYSSIDVPLQKGFNRIEFEALNQGLVGPNTAQFRVTDDNGILISANQWNLATGFKASIVLVKE